MNDFPVDGGKNFRWKTIRVSFERLCSRDVVFFQAAPFEGCFGFCDYCLTPLLRRDLVKGKIISRGGLDVLFRELQRLAQGLKGRRLVLQFGQFQDPCILEKWHTAAYGRGLMASLCEVLRKMPNVTLIVLSKFLDHRIFDRFDPVPNMILASTMNTDYVVRRYEHGTSTAGERLKNLEILKRQGWSVAVRVDPVMFYPAWKNDYRRLLTRVGRLDPRVVVFGLLRHVAELPLLLRRKMEQDNRNAREPEEEAVCGLMMNVLERDLLERSAPGLFAGGRGVSPLLLTRGIAANRLTRGLKTTLEQMGIHDRANG